MNKNEIANRLGANNWKEVEREYKGKHRGEIVANMYYMWPNEEAANEEIADAIVEQLGK